MNDRDWEQDNAEFEKNAAAMRELAIPPAAFAAVRQRVLSEIQAKEAAAWWMWSAVAAAACVATLFVAYLRAEPAEAGGYRCEERSAKD